MRALSSCEGHETLHMSLPTWRPGGTIQAPRAADLCSSKQRQGSRKEKMQGGPRTKHSSETCQRESWSEQTQYDLNAILKGIKRCAKRHHIDFSNPVCIIRTVKHSLKKKKKVSTEKTLHRNFYSHKHRKKQSCQQIHLHLSPELVQLSLGRVNVLSPIHLFLFADIARNKVRLERDFYYHPFLQCTLHFHIFLCRAWVSFILFIFNSLPT